VRYKRKYKRGICLILNKYLVYALHGLTAGDKDSLAVEEYKDNQHNNLSGSFTLNSEALTIHGAMMTVPE